MVAFGLVHWLHVVIFFLAALNPPGHQLITRCALINRLSDQNEFEFLRTEFKGQIFAANLLLLNRPTKTEKQQSWELEEKYLAINVHAKFFFFF